MKDSIDHNAPARTPVAIIGRACRLPGARCAEDFWRLMLGGRCAIGQIGGERWETRRYTHPRPGTPGKSYTFAAGLIDDVWGFDAAAFGISPREAVQMDPQQRLALMLVWEALEDAGLPPSSLRGERVGVYAGVSSLDHGNLRLFDTAGIDGATMAGNSLALVANRVSHAFDFKGESLAIDTACSSSLVALHHAVGALRRGDISLAVVIGVNLLLSPLPFIGFSAARMLSPEGRCHPFGADAQGYVRGEGGIVFVLARGDAAGAGRGWHGEIVATGANADGHTFGIALPSAASQTALLQAVYDGAGISADDLAFIEAHGTGTKAGDAAEAAALGEAVACRRRAPLLIGSLKGNIGHLEPAAGLAGVLKATLALEHGVYPPTLSGRGPNPDIAFAALNLRVACEPVQLDGSGGGLAGVSAFGFGGANAHAVIARSTRGKASGSRSKFRAGSTLSRADTTQRPSGKAGLFCFSARCAGALAELAGHYRARLRESGADPARLAAAIAHRRDLMEERAAILTGDPGVEDAALAAAAQGAPHLALARGRAVAAAAKTALVFPGNGAQWAGMGVVAYRSNPAFAMALDTVSRRVQELGGPDLVAAMRDPALAERLGSAMLAQPLLFAIQAALADCLLAMGLKVAAVIGHSVGEVAAAYASGALTLDDAARLIVKRSLHQEPSRGAGTIAAAQLPPPEAETIIRENGLDDVCIAAFNSPLSVTVSGSHRGIGRFHEIVAARQIRSRILNIDYPFHSPAMEPCREALIASLKCLQPGRERLPFISTVTGGICGGETLDADYWWRNVRQPVLFARAVEEAVRLGCEVFLELGPRPILQKYLLECLSAAGRPAAVVASLGRQDDAAADPVRMTLARAFVSGAALDTERAFGPEPDGNIELPAYPWQLADLRIAPTAEAYPGAGGALQPPYHPLIGEEVIAGAPLWRSHLDANTLAWLNDHRVAGRTVLPGAAIAEMAAAAACRWLGSKTIEIFDLDIALALVLESGKTREIEVRLLPECAQIVISSRARLSGDAWEKHATCRFRCLPDSNVEPVPASRPQGGMTADGDAVYARLRAAGLDYGPAFRRLDHAVAEPGGDIWASLRTGTGEPACAHLFDPVALDAALHALACMPELDMLTHGAALVPVRIGSLRVHRPGREPHAARLRVRARTARAVTVDALLLDAVGLPCLTLEGVRLQAAAGGHAADIDAMALTWQAKPVDLPGRDEDAPSARMQTALDDALGKACSRHGEPEDAREARLLLEAGAHRLAFDVLRALADADGCLEPAALAAGGRLHETRLPYVHALAGRLAAASLAAGEERQWRIASQCPMPGLEVILKTVLADHPDWGADCVVLNHAAALLPELLASPTGSGVFTAATREHVLRAAPRHALRRAALVDALVAWIEAQDGGRHRRAAQLQAQDAALALALRPLWASGALSLSIHPASPAAEHDLREALPASPYLDVMSCRSLDDAGAGTEPPFDAVATLGEPSGGMTPERIAALARRALRRGGLLLVSPAPESFLYDVAFGLETGWFHERDPGGKPPRNNTSAAWRKALLNAEFVVHQNASCPELLLAATAVMQGNARAVLPPPETAEARVHASARMAPLALALAGALSERGFRTLIANGEDGDDAAASPLPTRRRDAHAIVLLDQVDTQANSESDAIARSLAGLQAVLARPETPKNVWICIEGGTDHLIAGEHANPGAAALWAAARSVANEMPGHVVRLVDFEPALSHAEKGERLARWIAAPGAETELRLERNGAWRPSVMAGSPAPHNGPCIGQSTQAAARLGLARSGPTRRLRLERADRRAPGPGEIEVAVHAAGLNFRDVMWATGLLPEEAMEDGFAGASLGFECAGIVACVGDGVHDLAIGDSVAAMAPAAIASHVTVMRRAAVKLPPGLPLAAAATMPVAFVTAHHALVRLAALAPGDWLLVHGAAGGVGLAALQIAQARGARVIATAGTPEKRSLLTLMGAEHVLNSRSPAWAEDIRALTGGVDVVLNTVSGEAMEQSLRLLKPFGRFLELGKRDFFTGTMIDLRPLRRNISYFAVDADQLIAGRPDLVRQTFEDILAQTQAGRYRPLPHRVFPATEARQAFRLMQQSGHVGKIVIAAPSPADCPAPRSDARFVPCPEGIHVIVGGLGGVGTALAAWLADMGARRLVLIGRSGRARPDAEAVHAALRQRRLDLRWEACDVADQEALARLLERLRTEAPIKGIIHAAMALDDAPLAQLTHARIAAVLCAKVDGAAHLDRLTRRDKLDYFVMLSSLSAMIGNPGQAPYAAANAYLEALALRRRSEGLPALAIGLGAIADAGYLARNPGVAKTLARRSGNRAMAMTEVCGVIGECLSRATSVPASLTLAHLDWLDASAALPALRTPPFEALRRLAGREQTMSSSARVDLAALIREMGEDEARETAARLIAEEIASVLRLPPESIDRKRTLAELGMDSLTLVEFQMAAEARLGLDAATLIGAPDHTIDVIAARLVRRIRAGTLPDDSRDAEVLRDLADKHLPPGTDIDEGAPQRQFAIAEGAPP